MPLTYEILPARGIVLITYWGIAGLEESGEVFGRYTHDPDAAPGQKYLFDLSRVTGVEDDFPRFMEHQARAAPELGARVKPSMMVYYCPTPEGRRMAEMMRRTWDGLNGPPIAAIEDEAEALALVGCSEGRIEDLKRRVVGE